MRKTSEKLIVIDLEATCWEKSPPPGQESDIIEIGICEISTTNLMVQKADTFLIKPIRSTVSPFCTELTTLTNDLLEKEGMSFGKAIDQIQTKYNPRQSTWASWGDYDRSMLKKSCAEYNVPYPFGKTHLNIKSAAALLLGERERGMLQVLAHLGLTHDGTHHRGLDDALNIAKIWITLCKKIRGL